VVARACQPNHAESPNIIFIMADDLGYGDLGCYGQEIIKTPNIDRLAAEGMKFTQFYAGCTVSAPSRSSLITGLHTGHTPVRGNKHFRGGDYPHPEGTYTISKMLKYNGYATGCFGKWGLGAPSTEGAPHQQGFDSFFGYNSQALAHHYYPYYLWSNQDTVWLEGNRGNATGQYAQDMIHENAIRFIRTHKDRPFFAYLTYVIPHAELVNPDDSIFAMYDGKFSEKPYQGVDNGPSFRKGPYGSTSHPKTDFAAMVTRLDAYVGDICHTLKELGIDRNTVVIFTSDNGPHVEGGADPAYFKSSGTLRGVKRDLYEGGIRVPFIAWYPSKIKAGSVNRHVAAFWDVMATLAELTKTKTPENTDGISFLPTLYGKKKQRQHEYLYWEFHEQGGKMAVRKAEWKAIRLNVNHSQKTIVELYDLSDDIREQHNVAEQHPEIVAEMLKIMQEAHQYSAPFPFDFEKIIL
jgi:arylsulfatase A-like enzyme